MKLFGRLLLLAALGAHTMPALAHEIGTTRATLVIRDDGTYQLDVTADPDGLLTKLEAYTGGAISESMPRAARDRRIIELASVFLARVHVQFDDVAAHAAFELLPPGSSGSTVQTECVVRLTGQVPAGAHVARVSNGLALGTYALTNHIGARSAETVWVTGTAPGPAISIRERTPTVSRSAVARQYLALGYTHILPNGLDHILFVLGLFLVNARWRSVFAQVSAFTVAHSITLALTMYGIVGLPSRVVEPMIAVSIAYIAFENLFSAQVGRSRIAVVFLFGLLHGMGFAGVLEELGLPRTEFLTGLVTFNVGVEAGQLSVILLAFVAVAYWRRNAAVYRRLIVQPASLAIAAVGIFWTVARVFGM